MGEEVENQGEETCVVDGEDMAAAARRGKREQVKRQVVQTCLLSKRWEKTWQSFQVMEFDRTIFDRGLWYNFSYANIEVNMELQRRAKGLFSCLVRILQNRQCGDMISLKKLMIDMDLFNDPQFRTLLDQCICYAIGCNVKELKLKLNSFSSRLCNLPEVVFSSKSIEVLELKCCMLELSKSVVELSSLRNLCLNRVYVGDHMIENLVVGCPLIEDLKLVSCEGFRSLELFGLSKLNGIKLIDNSDLRRVVIKTPNVSLVSIGGPTRPRKIKLAFCRNLKKLILSCAFITDKWLHHQISKLPELEYLRLYKLYGLKSLKLSSPSLKMLLILECTDLVEINIGSPNLQFFDYQGDIISLSINALSLTKINLHLCNRILDARWYAKYVEYLAKFHDFSEVLNLQSDMVENMIVTRELREMLPSPLSTVKHLNLRLVTLSIYLIIAKLVDGLLWIAPHTKTVSIEYGDLDKTSFKGRFGMAKKTKVEEFDRISELSDPILHHIFSFLPFRQVVQTCVLSKRWERTWHSSPVLEFDRTIFDSYPSDSIQVNRKLRRRAKELFSSLLRILHIRQLGEMINIKKFTIDMDLFYDPEFRSLLVGCICYAIGCNVKELKLKLNSLSVGLFILPEEVFSLKSIEVLELKCCMLESVKNVKLSSLSKLCLNGVYADDKMIENLVVGCPLIEDLRLDKLYGLKSLKLSSPSLKMLLILGCTALVEINIGCPNLQFFDYQGDIISLSLNALSLTKINLHLCNRILDARWYAKYVEYLAKFHDFSEVLNLQSDMVEDMIVTREFRETLPSPLSRVKHLNLILDTISIHRTIAKVVDGLLWIAPHTTTISIEYDNLAKSSIKFSFSYKKQVTYEEKMASCFKSLPISCWQHCVEKVGIEINEINDEFYQGGKTVKSDEDANRGVILVSLHLHFCSATNRGGVPPLFALYMIDLFSGSERRLIFKGSVADMDGGAGPSLYPLHRCKTIHLVRHAQGIHNVEGDKNFKAYMSPEYFDAHLTQLGWQQVGNLRKHVQDKGLLKNIDLVITSPLLRTMQTAVGVFGGDGYEDRMDVVPLMVANAGNSDRGAISSLNSPPFIAVELCREHLGVHPCDKRRSISDYQFLFPAIDFSLAKNDEDVLWKADIRETKAEVAARGLKFLNCFANCELRSMVIVDKGMAGSDSSTTNYPGKIPSGPDLPSDVADKLLKKEGPSTNSEEQ
ncbi:hypothetical protein EZV62_019348 [Acer yangbiense]|uniref:Uncharacterized protein n=1 Tax=Acer yangbiense TaxID=1000413 RepID=A0A5C7HC78_9ROSI|nr:hypothetical protein EZV62_019348 [Acer yangbiense]